MSKSYVYESKDERENGNGNSFKREVPDDVLKKIKSEIYDDVKRDLTKNDKRKHWTIGGGIGTIGSVITMIALNMLGLNPLTGEPQKASGDHGKQSHTVVQLSQEDLNKIIGGSLTAEDRSGLRELFRITAEVKKGLEKYDESPMDIIRHPKDTSVHVWNKENRELNPIIKGLSEKTSDNSSRLTKVEQAK